MRKKIILVGVLALALTSCGNSSKSESGDENDSIEVLDETIEEESVTSNSEWDTILDEYEEFVDKSLNLASKAQSGDVSALTEYTETMQKMQNLQLKLQNAQSEMTPEQLQRLTQIITKLSNAAAALQ